MFPHDFFEDRANLRVSVWPSCRHLRTFQGYFGPLATERIVGTDGQIKKNILPYSCVERELIVEGSSLTNVPHATTVK